MHPLGLLREPAGQHDDLADHELDDAAGVGVGRVEHRDAALGGRGQVDLVGADAEATDRDQVGRGVEHGRGQVGVGADAEQVDPREGLDEILLGEGAAPQLDLEAMVSQGRIGSAIDRLDKLMPGLGNIARKNAGPGILAGLDAIGKRTTLDGKPAVTVPLRFIDGRVMLGPLPVGRTPPLF